MGHGFGEDIRRARKQKGWTQEELAKALHVKRSVISKYENGIIEPTVSRFKEIAQALDVDDWTHIATGEAIIDHLIDDLDTLDSSIKPQKLNESEMQKSGALTFQSDDHRISYFYNLLSDEGKRVAADRVQELTEIPKYQRKREPGKEGAPDEP